MDPDLPQIEAALSHWPDAAGGKTERLTPTDSLSSALLYRVSTPAGDRLLKRHGQSTRAVSANAWWGSACRRSHQFQNHLAAIEPRLVARLFAATDGKTLVHSRGCFWQLETWLAGAADFHQSPSEHRLVAAAKALARLHVVAASYSGADSFFATRDEKPLIRHDLGLRLANCQKLLRGELEEMVRQLKPIPQSPATALLSESLRLVAPQLPALANELAGACETTFDVKWILGDVREANILFAGAEVTGFVDLGSARKSIQAGDLARMLGSMVGDDRAKWLMGMAAYESVRPLPLAELRVMDLLRRSEVVLSGANWVRWLMPGEPLAAEADEQHWRRLAALVERLRGLRRWE